jgi:hypothetical protein
MLTIPRKQLTAMENYLEFVNKLPLDKEGKMEFVKAHIDRLKQYEKETENNKNNFKKVLQEIESMGESFEVFCECKYDEEKFCDDLYPLSLVRC